MTDLPHDQDTPIAPSSHKSNAPVILWSITGLMVTALTGAAAWYITQGFLKNPDETGQQIRAAYMQGDGDRIYQLMDPQAQQTLSAEFIKQAVQLNSNYKAIALDYQVTKGEGYFNRNAELVLSNPNTKTIHKYKLNLEGGRWILQPHNVIVYALQNKLSLLQKQEGDFTPPAFEDESLTVGQLNKQNDAYTQKVLAFEQKATNWIRALSAFDPAFKTTLLKDIEKARKLVLENNSDYLSWRTSSAVQNNIDHLLEKANEAYDRADHPKALSLLQQVIKIPEITNANKAYAFYLMSFVYRDYEAAPNHMQNAIETAQDSTEFNADNASYWCHYGDNLRLYDLPEKAIQAFQRGLRVQSSTIEQQANCWTWLGVAYQENRDFYSAASAWRKALSLVPTEQDAMRFLDQISQYGY